VIFIVIVIVIVYCLTISIVGSKLLIKFGSSSIGMDEVHGRVQEDSSPPVQPVT